MDGSAAAAPPAAAAAGSVFGVASPSGGRRRKHRMTKLLCCTLGRLMWMTMTVQLGSLVTYVVSGSLSQPQTVQTETAHVCMF